MQPVRVPGAPVLHGPERPEVEDGAVVAIGDGPYMSGVRGYLAAQMAQDGHAPGVEAGGDHDGGDSAHEVGDGAFETFGDIVGVGARPDDVVAAGTERHQVRGEFLRTWNLLGHDLVEEPAPYSEIGVPEIAVRRVDGFVAHRQLVGEQDRQPVRPADIPAFGTQIPHSLGETVTDRCVRPDDVMSS